MYAVEGRIKYSDDGDDDVDVKRHSLHSDLQAIERELLGEGDPVEGTTEASLVPTTSDLVLGKKMLYAGGAEAAERSVYAPPADADDASDAKVAYGAVMQKPEGVPVGKDNKNGGKASGEDDFNLLHYLLYNSILSRK